MDAGFLNLGLLLIVLGFLLSAGELFLPTHGIMMVLGVASIGGGVFLIFTYDNTIGMWALLGVFIAVPIVGSLVIRVWPRTPLGKRFFLTAPPEDATVAAMPVHQELEKLKGRIGRTLSALRPAGVVDFDGRRIDTITEGMMVEPGQLVRCIDVQAGRVIVRPVEKPTLGDLETAVFNV
jgi:membrane-bound serine protease (ClpP class)